MFTYQGDLISAFSATSLSSLTNPLVLTLIINNAVLGIVTSLFLKKLNSILKAFASALELVITAVLSVPILGIPLTPTTVMALGKTGVRNCWKTLMMTLYFRSHIGGCGDVRSKSSPKS